MSNEDVENYIRQNVVWADLPHNIQQILGNSLREYGKRVLDVSIKNQLRHKGNIVRFIEKDAEVYYNKVLKYATEKMVLYPYHLIDVFASGLRILPFEYYSKMMENLLKDERPFDSLPNFTASDCTRLLGIGRNQFIELQNENRSYRKLFRRKTIQELLPQKPMNFPIEPWYMLRHGYLLDNDVKLLEPEEKQIIDQLVEFPILCGLLDKRLIYSLHARGLVYFEVPINDEDYVYVPTLDGFVMNRLQGDYFENLLYKIFVTIDGQMSVKELADVIGISGELVKNAISVLCRLGFVKKRNSGIDNVAVHRSWQGLPSSTSMSSSLTDESGTLTQSLAELSISLTSQGDDDDNLPECMEESMSESIKSPVSTLSTPMVIEPSQKRIAFMIDFSLTAFLMMGNLSATLKNYAVTLYEVGKLSDSAAVENFIAELANINFFDEGDAQRYTEHAKSLLNTIITLRVTNEIELIRGESLLSLDQRARERMIKKYRLIISMGPLSPEACAFSRAGVPHIGNPIVEMASPFWFRLYLYSLLKNGPFSILYPMGSAISAMPTQFNSKRLILTTSSHDPNIILADNALTQLNDSLLSSAVLIQEYSDVCDDSEIVNIAFPILDDDEHHLSNHPSIKTLREKLNLDSLCGYITLLQLKKPKTFEAGENLTEDSLLAPTECDADRVSVTSFRATLSSTVTKDPRKVKSNKTKLANDEKFEDFVVFDCVFGVPLFDETLNERICERIISNGLLEQSNMENISFATRNISESVSEFVQSHRDKGYENLFGEMESNFVPLPTDAIVFDSGHISILNTL